MLKIGIVGCGNIFTMHANAVNRLENAELVAVCDCKEERSKAMGEKYHARYYVDYKEMMKQEKLDIVHLCLPHYLHAAVGEYFAKEGVHILTEKPMDISVERAQMLVDSCKENNVRLGVIFQNRYRKTNRMLKEFLDKGTHGKVLGAKMSLSWLRTEAYYKSTGWKGFWATEGGGVIIDQAIHTLDYLNWVLGGDIEYIEASMGNRFHPNIEVEDFAEGYIRYREGFGLTFHACNYYSYDAPVELEIETEEAILRMVGSKLEITYRDGSIYTSDISIEDLALNGNLKKTYWGTTHITQISEFYEYVENKRTSFLVDGEEGMKIQKLVEGIYESAKKQSRIYL